MATAPALQVPRRRSRVAFAKRVADDETCFRDMPYHRHVALLALIGVTSLTFFRHDLRRVDVERVAGRSSLRNRRRKTQRFTHTRVKT